MVFFFTSWYVPVGYPDGTGASLFFLLSNHCPFKTLSSSGVFLYGRVRRVKIDTFTVGLCCFLSFVFLLAVVIATAAAACFPLTLSLTCYLRFRLAVLLFLVLSILDRLSFPVLCSTVVASVDFVLDNFVCLRMFACYVLSRVSLTLSGLFSFVSGSCGSCCFLAWGVMSLPVFIFLARFVSYHCLFAFFLRLQKLSAVLVRVCVSRSALASNTYVVEKYCPRRDMIFFVSFLPAAMYVVCVVVGIFGRWLHRHFRTFMFAFLSSSAWLSHKRTLLLSCLLWRCFIVIYIYIHTFLVMG